MRATPEERFPCTAGTRATADGSGSVLWIRSPWTNVTLELCNGSFARELPGDLVTRILGAGGSGLVEFTLAELKAFRAAVTAATPPAAGSFAPRRRRRQW